MVIARLHVQMIEAARGGLSPAEEIEAWEFIKFLVLHVQEKRDPAGWVARMTELSAYVLTALADKFPEEEEKWIGVLREFMADTKFPDEYDGGKAYSWINTVIRLDAWAWGASWENGELRLSPRRSLIEDPRAPKQARVWTPEGWKEVGLD